MERVRGFSIVELIVVIVVIAILITITIVGYGWITEDARDAARRQRASEIAKAIRLLYAKKNVQQIGGLNNAATGAPIGSDGLCKYEVKHFQGGWLYNPPKADGRGYPCDIGQMLVANGIASKELLSTGPRNDEFVKGEEDQMVSSMMFLRCLGDPETFVLYYHVKNPTPEETREFNRLIDQDKCGRSGYMHSKAIVGDRCKMKAAIEIKI